jgi:hypothetical protein
MIVAATAAFALSLVSTAGARPDLSNVDEQVGAAPASQPRTADAAAQAQSRVEPIGSASGGTSFDWPTLGIMASALLAVVGVVLTAAAGAALRPRTRDPLPRP